MPSGGRAPLTMTGGFKTASETAVTVQCRSIIKFLRITRHPLLRVPMESVPSVPTDRRGLSDGLQQSLSTKRDCRRAKVALMRPFGHRECLSPEPGPTGFSRESPAMSIVKTNTIVAFGVRFVLPIAFASFRNPIKGLGTDIVHR